MSRVVSVIDPQTIAVESDGTVRNVRLAGIEILDARNALALLSWSVGKTWVLVEDGFVYRSPDGLFVNRELVARGYARSTATQTAVFGLNRGTYLGEGAPGTAQRSTTPRTSQPPRKTVQPASARRPSRKPLRLMPLLTAQQK